MQPCPNCGRTELTPAGNCQNCGVFRGDESQGYGPPSSAPPYPGQASGPPHDPYQQSPYQQPQYQQYQQPYQQQSYQAPQGQVPQGYVGQPQPARRPSTVPLIILSVIAVILVVGIVGVVLVRASDSDNPGGTGTGTGTGTGGETVAAGIDKCVVGKWRVTNAKERVDVSGELAEFTATGGTVELKGDGTGKIDYGSGVTYRGTVSGQPVTITLSGTASFSYKTVDDSFTFSNTSADGEAVLKVNGVTTTTIPLDMDTKPAKYTCTSTTLTQTTDLATTEMRKQ
jgi:hypothetical protein